MKRIGPPNRENFRVERAGANAPFERSAAATLRAAWRTYQFVSSSQHCLKYLSFEIRLSQNIVSLDELLDNVMLYWLPNAGASSARIYWESFGSSTLSSLPVTVPSAISIFPKEIFKTSERWARQRYKDLRYFNQLTKGGHFAAFEQPDLFVQELRAAFDQMRD